MSYFWKASLCFILSTNVRHGLRSLPEQIAAFQRIQVLRHGPSKIIYGDNEDNKEPFKTFCKDFGGRFAPIPANDHQANGTIEGANRFLKAYFRRVRSADKKSSIAMLFAEATYAKNICVGSKGASAFQLLYGRSPTRTSMLPLLRITK